MPPQRPRPGQQPQNLQKMLRQVQQMQQDMASTQAALGDEVVEGSAGGGVVKVVVTGHQQVRSITISPDVVDPADVEMLADLVTAAVNDGLDRSRQLAEERMGAVTGGIDLGSLGGSLGLNL